MYKMAAFNIIPEVSKLYKGYNSTVDALKENPTEYDRFDSIIVVDNVPKVGSITRKPKPLPLASPPKVLNLTI